MPEIPFTAIDHVQLARPAGQEEAARAFYVERLGLVEVPKPAELADRGGAWFNSGMVHIHLGVEADFRPARKAHPAFLCQNYAALVARLRSSGITMVEAESLSGKARCHVFDPFGNRIELVEA